MDAAPNIVQRWKRFLVCGCSHGELADPSALAAVVRFRDDFKPHVCAHLGDALDTTAFRSGAHGTKDQSADVSDDVLSASDFLRVLRPTLFMLGNHEHRVWNFLQSPNALIKRCAQVTVEELRDLIEDELKAQFVNHYDITRSWVQLGPYLLGHGWMYGENAARDHAETVGNCIIAHTHSFAVARGRVAGGATCISVGMLADVDKLSYAHGRRATHKWTVSFLSGEYTDTHLVYRPHIIREPCAREFPKAQESTA